MRDMVWIGAEPWASVFAELQKSPFASLDYRPSGPFETISSDRETYSQTRASTAVYELALMWYITGKKEYADKSIGIMMDWAETVKKSCGKGYRMPGDGFWLLSIGSVRQLKGGGERKLPSWQDRSMPFVFCPTHSISYHNPV